MASSTLFGSSRTSTDVTPRPLIVWTHHKEVANVFPNGRLPVFIGSITAADVDLTGASDALFVEQTWSMSLMVQAEDQMHHVGQDARGCSTARSSPSAPSSTCRHVPGRRGSCSAPYTGRAADVAVIGAASGDLQTASDVL